MEKINATVKKWGNSFGIILPKDLIESQKLKEGSNIDIVIQAKNKTKVKDIFGIMKGKIKRDTADLLREVDEDFGNQKKFPEKEKFFRMLGNDRTLKGAVFNVPDIMNNYFFDTYAIIEIIKGNEKYNFAGDLNIITSPMNYAEVYYALLLLYDKDAVSNMLKNINFQFLNITPEITKSAAIFRHKNKKANLSYIDCVGYELALNNDLLFLTGDKAFEDLENVEFVRK